MEQFGVGQAIGVLKQAEAGIPSSEVNRVDPQMSGCREVSKGVGIASVG